MNKCSTQENLIKYLYNETNDIENVILENEIICNDDVCEEYTSLSATKNLLEAECYKPSEDSVNAILGYAKALDVIHLKSRDESVILN